MMLLSYLVAACGLTKGIALGAALALTAKGAACAGLGLGRRR